MKKIGKLLLVAMVLTFTASMVFPPSASAKLARKVDNILVLIDASGSMSEPQAGLTQPKINSAVDMVARLDKAIPELGYTTGVYTVAPFEVISPLQTYQNGALVSAANGVDTSIGLRGNLSPVGTGLKAATEEIATGLKVGEETEPLPGKTAIILLTDGGIDVGADPVVATQALYDQFPDSCVHVVSLADNDKEQMIIDQIRAVSGCSVDADVNSLSTKAGMDRFASNVLYEEVPDEVAMVVEEEVITFNLLFGFDKAAITDDMVPVLEQTQMILEEDPNAEFIVAGHTDSIGSEEYNQGLSERRAGAVVDWLTNNGVDGGRLDAIGYGETQPKFDNSTEDGRNLNRRVEIMAK